VDEMLADPIELNSRLGTYTNFVNLLDLCALSVPAAILPEGIPFGVTLIGRAGEDAALAAIGRFFHAETELPMGATGKMQPVLGAER
jgi:allophanate hydrolase